MTNEEAIVLLEDQMNFNRTMQRGWGNSMIETDAGKIVDGALYANQHKDVADALELAINALRTGGKGMNVPTMPAGQPLTMEQLRGMDGQEIKIVVIEENITLSGKVLEKREFVSGEDRCKYMFSSFGETWIAYAYPPAHIDREAWTSEWINSIPALGAGDLETRCKSCGNLVLFETDFCPYCGKAMTEEAWAELEKRMGIKTSEAS